MNIHLQLLKQYHNYAFRNRGDGAKKEERKILPEFTEEILSIHMVPTRKWIMVLPAKLPEFPTHSISTYHL